jgi:hypothetical protein
MLVNPSVGRFQHQVDATVAQILESVRTFHRALGDALSRRIQLISLIAAMRQRVDSLLSQAEPLLRAFRQVFGEVLSRQTHLKLLATKMRDRVDAVLLQSEPLLHRISQLYGSPNRRKTVGHLEKLLSLAIADSPGVNVNESERERSGIIRRQFCGVRRVEAIFRGAHRAISFHRQGGKSDGYQASQAGPSDDLGSIRRHVPGWG